MLARHKSNNGTIVTSFNKEEAELIVRALEAYNAPSIIANVTRKLGHGE